MENSYLQINYFPYLFLDRIRSITFCGFAVRNSKDFLDQIGDAEVKTKVGALIAMNRIHGKPIQNMGIVEVRNEKSFLPLTREEMKTLGDLRSALFLAGMAESNISDDVNAGLFALVSENFRVVQQNFTLDSPYAGYASGRILKQSDSGYKVSELAYEKPLHVPRTTFSCDSKLLRTLERTRRRNSRLFRLIMRATDSVMNAYSNSEDVSHESRILELCRAFEILLQLPEREQRKAFKEVIRKYCEPDGEKQRRYLSERPGKRKEIEKGSRQVMWADRFYVLRNHIIHGDRLKSKDFAFYGQPHLRLGLWFFLVTTKQMMNKALGRDGFYDFIRCEEGKLVYDEGRWREATVKALQMLRRKRGHRTKQ